MNIIINVQRKKTVKLEPDKVCFNKIESFKDRKEIEKVLVRIRNLPDQKFPLQIALPSGLVVKINLIKG